MMIMVKIPLMQLQAVRFLLALAILLYVPGLASGALSINHGGESFTVSVSSYEYPYTVSGLSLTDKGDALIITGTLKVESNATMTAKTGASFGYISSKTADAKLEFESSKDGKISPSGSEYIFTKDISMEPIIFILTVPRVPGLIHFGKNSTILSINAWACGLNVTNDILNYEYGGGTVGFEFSDRGFVLNAKNIFGAEYGIDDAGCNTGYHTHLTLHTLLSANTIPNINTQYMGAVSLTNFYVNQSWSRGNSSGEDTIFFGYPFVISMRNSTYSSWLSSLRLMNNGLQISTMCGNDLTGSRICHISNAASKRRITMYDYADTATDSVLYMFDSSYVNSTNDLMISFQDTGSYDYLLIGSEDFISFYLPNGTHYALWGWVHIQTTQQESYYGNLTFDHFLLYPNPTVAVSGSDSILFNNFKLIHINDENLDGEISLNVVPNSLNNGTWWYFDFSNKTMQNLYIEINGVTCYYNYNPATFIYDTSPTCPFIDNVEISTGAGIGAGEITAVALLNYKFSTNSSQSMNIGEYFPPPPLLNATITCDVCHDLPVKMSFCADNFTLRTIRERTSCDSTACETYNQTDNILCVNGCYEGITQNGAGCAPMNIEVITYAFAGFLILITGIYFISARFNRGSRKAGRF
jgi:hypothetical protein